MKTVKVRWEAAAYESGNAPEETHHVMRYGMTDEEVAESLKELYGYRVEKIETTEEDWCNLTVREAVGIKASKLIEETAKGEKWQKFEDYCGQGKVFETEGAKYGETYIKDCKKEMWRITKEVNILTITIRQK